MATLTHPPDLCLARKEYSTESRAWVGNTAKQAKKLGVKVHGAYLCPNEHTFYFVLETDSMRAVSEFLSPPMLTHHAGKVTPVLTVEEAFGLSFVKKK